MDLVDHELMITIITIVGSVLASSGFWAYLQSQRDRKNAKNDANGAFVDLLKGLAHDRIVFVGNAYLERGWVTKDEYEDFVKYLYEPYERVGGNGMARKVMREVENLPLTEPEMKRKQ
jgi:hypothetical protein